MGYNEYKKYLERLRNDLWRRGINIEGMDLDKAKSCTSSEILPMEIFFGLNDVARRSGSSSAYIGVYSETYVTKLREKLLEEYLESTKHAEEKLLEQPTDAGILNKKVIAQFNRKNAMLYQSRINEQEVGGILGASKISDSSGYTLEYDDEEGIEEFSVEEDFDDEFEDILAELLGGIESDIEEFDFDFEDMLAEEFEESEGYDEEVDSFDDLDEDSLEDFEEDFEEEIIEDTYIGEDDPFDDLDEDFDDEEIIEDELEELEEDFEEEEEIIEDTYIGEDDQFDGLDDEEDYVEDSDDGDDPFGALDDEEEYIEDSEENEDDPFGDIDDEEDYIEDSEEDSDDPFGGLDEDEEDDLIEDDYNSPLDDDIWGDLDDDDTPSIDDLMSMGDTPSMGNEVYNGGNQSENPHTLPNKMADTLAAGSMGALRKFLSLK